MKSRHNKNKKSFHHNREEELEQLDELSGLRQKTETPQEKLAREQYEEAVALTTSALDQYISSRDIISLVREPSQNPEGTYFFVHVLEIEGSHYSPPDHICTKLFEMQSRDEQSNSKKIAASRDITFGKEGNGYVLLITKDNAPNIISMLHIAKHRVASKEYFLAKLKAILTGPQGKVLSKQGETPLSFMLNSSFFAKTPKHIAELKKAFASHQPAEGTDALFAQIVKIMRKTSMNKSNFRSATMQRFYKQLRAEIYAIRQQEHSNDSIEHTPQAPPTKTR